MKEVILANRDKNEIIEEIKAIVPPAMFNNPAFNDMINTLSSKYPKLTVDGGKVLFSNSKKQSYSDNNMDSITNFEEVEVSLDEQDNLIYDLTSNSLIRNYQHQNYNTNSEYNNHLSTNYVHKVFAPDGLQEIEQIYRDAFDSASSRIDVPYVNLDVYRPKFEDGYVTPAYLVTSASAKTAIRSSIPNTVSVIEQENLGTPNLVSKKNLLPTNTQHPLYIQVPYGAKPYNEEFDRPDVMEREVMSDFLDQLDVIRENDEKAYEVFMNRVTKTFGSIDNFKMKIEEMGLESKFESRTI